MTTNLPANPFGGTVALRDPASMASAMQDSASRGALGMAPDGCDYMNFSGKRGVYEFGREKENIDPSELWLVNVQAFEDGWVCWKGGTTVASRMSNIFNGVPVPEPDFNEHGPFDPNKGEGWAFAKSMVVKSLEEDDRQGYFKINSKSGVASFADLQKECTERLTRGDAFWPVIRFSNEKFEAKGFKNYKPVLEVYGWLSQDAVMTLAGDPSADVDHLIEQSGGTVAQPAKAEPVAPKVATKAVRTRRGL